ncbi:hypothetical protein F511_41852 [Dorcoceras hygrometricum]|uniref:Uncharacterized protein n=1 Tax=Dorcoceras hygrometricum TaxID=472368 RepID=A0A2Z7DBZ7_9LAMI|nr:hypothetical protein F511_41852 [Dorcoceras hygrometricum]
MSSPNSNLVNRLAESLDRSSPPEASHRGNEVPSSTETHRARILRIDQDEARLAAQGCTWYEIKASTLRESDISYIKDKAGITSLYEVVIPHVHARAHRPPPVFHTFYVNQIDRGLRFPIPKFISSLCNHIGVPLTTYTLMQIITVKRLGPGKFYVFNRKQFGFIGGNPSSHKGWMSRYFFIKRISSREDPRNCDMSWRDDAYTLPPTTPEVKPDLTRFLEAIGDRCYSAQQLIEEDLLCFFKFSGKKARRVGDLGIVIVFFVLLLPFMKSDLFNLCFTFYRRQDEYRNAGSTKGKEEQIWGASSSHPSSKEKRQAPSEKKERRKKHRHEEKGAGSTQESIPEVTISKPVDPTTKDPEQQSTEAPYTLLDAFSLSFVSNPSGPASLDFIRRLVPNQDFDQLKKASDLGVFETVGLHFMQVHIDSGSYSCTLLLFTSVQSLAWFGEAANRFSKVRAEVIKTKHSMDGVLGRHEALMKQLEEIQTKENMEKESLSAELESARAEVQTLKAQMQSLEAPAQRSEEESKLHLAEVEKLQEEKANYWALEKEKFLKSKDFYSLCLKKAVMYFDKGFDGCLAQFRANGYSEEEHPASFLDVEQALVDMPEDPEEGSLNRDGTPPA